MQIVNFELLWSILVRWNDHTVHKIYNLAVYVTDKPWSTGAVTSVHVLIFCFLGVSL